MARLRFLALAFLLAPSASAQWAQTEGPIGADFHTLVALSETEVAAATLHGTAFTFAEGEWARQPDVTLPQRRLYRHGGRWYQLADGAVLVSVDEGRTWTDAGVPGAAVAIYGAPLAFYAATEEAVYATTDGATWDAFISTLTIEVPAGSSTTTGPLQMRHFAVHGGTFMANGHVNGHVGLFRTEDAGKTWARQFPAPPVDEFMAWGDTLYGFGCYSFRSSDGGLTWEPIEVPTVDGSAACFDYLAGAGDALLAQSSRHGVFRLDGDAWVRVHPAARGLSTSGGVAFAADEAGAYRTADGGATWEAMPRDLIATTVVPRGLGDGGALALTEQGFVHRTGDLVTWSEPAPITAAGLRGRALLVHPDAVLAATEDGVFRSTDGGLTWAEGNAGIDYHPFHLDRTPRFATNGEVVVVGFSYGFAQQGHGGTSFGGMYRSDDGGQSWASMNETFPRDDEGRPSRVNAVAMSGSTLVIYTPEGVFASADEGASWTPATGFPPGLGGLIRSLYGFGEVFYAITYGGQLYESVDGGRSWYIRREGLPPTQSVHDAHLFPLEGQTFLVVNKNGTGVGYRLSPTGWEQLDLEMPLGVRFNGFDVHGGLVLAGTVDAGVWTVPAEAFLTPTVASEEAAAPGFALSPAYPNPTAGRSRLTLTLGEAQPVRVEVLDVLGRQVALLHEGPLAAQAHTFTLPAPALPAGSYLVRATGPKFAEMRRLTVVR